MTNTIQVPKPCRQDWNTMTANEQGRHCRRCCKTVVDFTGREPQEIVQYLQTHQGHGVCGRFVSAQINTPVPAAEAITQHIFNSSLSYCKKIAALIVVTFGILVSRADKSYGQANKNIVVQSAVQTDSAVVPIVVGKVAYKPRATDKPVKKRPVKKVKYRKSTTTGNAHFIQGDVMLVPEPVTMGTLQVTPGK